VGDPKKKVDAAAMVAEMKAKTAAKQKEHKKAYDDLTAKSVGKVTGLLRPSRHVKRSDMVVSIKPDVEIDLSEIEIKPKLPAVMKPKAPERYKPLALINRGLNVPQYEKTLAAMRAFPFIFSHDRLRDRYYISNNSNVIQRNIDDDSFDNVVRKLRTAITQELNFDPRKEASQEAAIRLCLENQFHPVLDYLDSLKWDRKPRVDMWLTTYFGAENTELHRAFGRKVLIAAVRRMRKPGEKFDQMLVLESEKQGAGKSTALLIMAGDEFFSDSPILGEPQQKVQEALQGKWIYEIAELENLSKSDSGSIKAFLSRTTDRGRPAYGHGREDIGRTCIFVGTCNRDDYLKDATGNRRFWPVKCADKVDLDALVRDRDQLWAEACEIEATGESLELDRALWGEATKAQEARFDIHPWEDELRTITFYSNRRGVHWRENGEVRVASSWIMKDILFFNPAQMKGPDSHYVRDIMKRLGRDGPKVINGFCRK
jgi:hypothetical protein